VGGKNEKKSDRAKNYEVVSLAVWSTWLYSSRGGVEGTRKERFPTLTKKEFLKGDERTAWEVNTKGRGGEAVHSDEEGGGHLKENH